jgi:hypothetical protein
MPGTQLRVRDRGAPAGGVVATLEQALRLLNLKLA